MSDEMVLVVEGERPPLTSNGERPVGEDVLLVPSVTLGESTRVTVSCARGMMDVSLSNRTL